MSDSGKPYNKLLQQSSLDVTNAWTRRYVVCFNIQVLSDSTNLPDSVVCSFTDVVDVASHPESRIEDTSGIAHLLFWLFWPTVTRLKWVSNTKSGRPVDDLRFAIIKGIFGFWLLMTSHHQHMLQFYCRECYDHPDGKWCTVVYRQRT